MHRHRPLVRGGNIAPQEGVLSIGSQLKLGSHAVPQPPQCCAFVEMSTHAPPQHRSFEAAPHCVPSGSTRCAQAPRPSQASRVHRLPSLVQGVSIGTGRSVQALVPLHARSMHSSSSQVIGVPAQLPSLHWSSYVQGISSSQDPAMVAHAHPLVGSHVSLVQGFSSSQEIGSPAQMPSRQLSFSVHAF